MIRVRAFSVCLPLKPAHTPASGFAKGSVPCRDVHAYSRTMLLGGVMWVTESVQLVFVCAEFGAAGQITEMPLQKTPRLTK